jgi:hypothetical protein
MAKKERKYWQGYTVREMISCNIRGKRTEKPPPQKVPPELEAEVLRRVRLGHPLGYIASQLRINYFGVQDFVQSCDLLNLAQRIPNARKNKHARKSD